MKVFSWILLALLLTVDPATVKKINAAKSAAEDAYKKGDYPAAIRHYKYLVDSLGVHEDEVLLNLANAYFMARDTAQAVGQYQAATNSNKPVIQSRAYQQLGLMANQQGRAEEALNHFKQAIKAAPANDDARYNYEMLKKKLDEQKKKEEEQQQQNKDQEKQDPQNKDQQQKDQQNKDQQQKDQEKKDQQQKDQQQKDQEEKEKQEQEKEEQQKQEERKNESDREDMPNLDREKLEEMKISEEKARMILEAMKNQEKQYLQQQRRKQTQPTDRNKPDW